LPPSGLSLILPWEFSPTVLIVIALLAALYARGCARVTAAVPLSRRIAFFLGLLLIYCALQTSWDYYASHMFFVHRLQHFVLHDIGPALLAGSAPGEVLAKGAPPGLAARVKRVLAHLRPLGRVLLDPWTATTFFVASLLLWIWPPIHFDVMLSNGLYRLMNWSVVLGDLPFWWLVLDPRAYPMARVKDGYRLLMLFIVMLPMMLAGAILGLSRHDLYPVYAICGRFTSLSPLADQHLGGLIIWIPGNLLVLIVAFIVFRRMLHREHACAVAAAKPGTIG
jgi:putative membrane protein